MFTPWPWVLVPPASTSNVVASSFLPTVPDYRVKTIQHLVIRNTYGLPAGPLIGPNVSPRWLHLSKRALLTVVEVIILPPIMLRIIAVLFHHETFFPGYRCTKRGQVLLKSNLGKHANMRNSALHSGSNKEAPQINELTEPGNFRPRSLWRQRGRAFPFKHVYLQLINHK